MKSEELHRFTVAKKRFGQHFLHDQAIIQQIVNAIAAKPSDHLVEIGPGLGILTVQLLPLVHEMDVVELDRDLIPALEHRCNGFGKLRVHQIDVLKFDFATLLGPLRVVGNLPYNISTPLLFHLQKYFDRIKDMHFMLQKEVAERLVANPGTKSYGRLSVMIQYFCEAELLFEVGPEAFSPQPKVDSAVVRLVPRQHRELVVTDLKLFSEIVQAAFCHRRKTIHNSLKKYLTDFDFAQLALDANLRPEQLAVDDFVRICNGSFENL